MLEKLKGKLFPKERKDKDTLESFIRSETGLKVLEGVSYLGGTASVSPFIYEYAFGGLTVVDTALLLPGVVLLGAGYGFTELRKEKKSEKEDFKTEEEDYKKGGPKGSHGELPYGL